MSTTDLAKLIVAAQAIIESRDACQDDDIIRNIDAELDTMRDVLSSDFIQRVLQPHQRQAIRQLLASSKSSKSPADGTGS